MFCGTCQGQVPEYASDPVGKTPNDGLPFDTSLLPDASITPAMLNYGRDGDKSRCVTCSLTFSFFVPAEEKCYVTCNAGYYERVVGDKMNLKDFPSECGECVAPCETCTSCGAGDKNCNAVSGDFSKSGANFCTSCRQEGFFPEEFVDIGGK